jgi:hypothetical protein
VRACLHLRLEAAHGIWVSEVMVHELAQAPVPLPLQDELYAMGEEVAARPVDCPRCCRCFVD